MADEQNPVLDAEPIKTENESEPNHQEPEKKGRFKFHLILMLILGVGTWAFVTYSQTVKDWKQQWYDFTHQPSDISAPHQSKVESILDKQPLEMEIQPPIENTPILEEVPELKNLEAIDSVNAESLADLTNLVSQLQQQLTTIQENMTQMYSKDAKQSKQQVQAHLFAYLQKATFSHTSLEDAAIAWKSISLLPLIDNSRRMQAQQAWSDLYGVQKDIQVLNQEITKHIHTLAKKMKPQTLAEVAPTVDSLTDIYTNNVSNVSKTWVEWLEEQFKLTKVDSNALEANSDPYADIKDLIQNLELLKHTLNTRQWHNLPNLKLLVHQLQQYGIETSISNDLVEQMQQTQLSWQEQSRIWMEQL